MTTLAEQMKEAQRAWVAFLIVVVKTLGLPRFVAWMSRKLG